MIRNFWLAAIFVLALALRIVGVSDYPMGFTPDEASFGYNAYSLLKTGRDEWSVPFYKLPLTNLESFGDFKLPLYAFLAVPSVKLFGLNEFATRLPNAIFGSLAVLVIFVFTFKLLKYFKIENSFQNSKFKFQISLSAALLMAISPWSVQLSRGAFEANLVTVFLPLFLALLSYKFYFYSGLILVLNFYSYHSARYLSLILFIYYLFKTEKLPRAVFSRLLTIIFLIPGLVALFGPGGSRVSDVSILSPTDNWQSVSDSRFSAVQSGLYDPTARFFYNKLTYLFTQFIQNYLSYFGPEFLFTRGPRETTYGMFSGTGVMYPIEMFFILTALVIIIKNPSKNSIYYLLLLLLSIVPAALAKGPGYTANRAAPMLPFLVILSAMGAIYLTRFIKPIILVFVITISFAFFMVNYFYHARDLASGMLYGRREAIVRVSQLAPDYQRVFVSRSLSEPHIYVAFFTQFDPVEYQKQSQSWQEYHRLKLRFLDQYDGYTLDKYSFGSLEFKQANSLYVGLPQDFPSQIKPMFNIDYPDGRTAVQVSRL